MPAVTAADKAASTTRILGPPDVQLAGWEDRAEEGIRRALVQVMDRVADRIGKSLTAVLIAHLPGKHDQSTHGHGGVTGNAALAAAPLGLVDHQVDAIGRVKSKPGPGMAPEEAKALSSYRERGFVKVNKDLRKNDGQPSAATEKTIGTIDSAMSRSQLTSDISVERGISNGPAAFGERWQGDMTGMTFVDHAFVSTTTDHTIASEFADRIPGVSDGALATMFVPAGTSAIKLSDKGPFQEAELLLNRGLTYEVVSDTGPGAARLIDMRVVGS